MSRRLDALLRAEMERWESRGLRRDLNARPGVERAFEFTSNDYLSLAADESVTNAAREAIARFGVGGRAARLLGGGSELDARAELLCAEWLGDESALFFPSGYQANAGLLSCLADANSVVFSDKLNHASIIDAARLSRARVRVFDHCDVEHLDTLLAAERRAERRIVVTESVFSMDGDLAPLAAMHELCERHDAYLVVDEAHAVGLIGKHRAGAWAALDVKPSRLAARLVTGGKSLGVSGAFVVGSQALRDHLVNRARAFVFTTAASPAISGALCAAIETARADTDRAERALAVARTLAQTLSLPIPAAAIVPFVVGESAAALKLADSLLHEGLDVRAVRPPTVPDGSARLRIACHAHNSLSAASALGSRLAREPRRPAIETQALNVARAFVVIGTDTDIGKTVVSALLCRAALNSGPATYWKPVQTGTVSDTEEVARLAGAKLYCADPQHAFPLPASPHTAARAAGARVDVEGLHTTLAALRVECAGTLVIELAGGLLVPYDDETTQADWLQRTRCDTVLVARSGLGTLNHTLLTLEALAARGMRPRALFLVGEPHAANADTLRERTNLPLFELEHFDRLDAAALDAWIARNDVGALFT
ncbi:MAG: dethiobiotin synthase [Planctomycetes bacterium]|nr:dethiobiotin synthase [Planctomycetota bacterium]